MLQRHCNLPETKSFFLFGPRQTGKSTLVQQRLPPGALQFDLLRHDEHLRLARHPQALRHDVEAHLRAGGVPVVLIDEVQKVPQLLDEVHGLIERHGVRFWLTGSSSRKLKRSGANLLAGRAVTRHMHPLLASELGDAFELERALRLGTLPPVATQSDTDAIDLLRSYADTYLREEVQAEALVRNLGGFARFLDVVAAQNGDLLNHANIARDAGIAARTVLEYVQVLEDTLIGFRLPAYARGVRARLVSHPKFFLFDNGVTNAVRRRLDAVPDQQERGRLFEAWVIGEVRRLVDLHHPEAQLFFWRTNHGAEVDLLLELHGRLRVAAEIKVRAHIDSVNLTGLRSFAIANPGVPQVVVCTAERPSRLGEVDVLPWRVFLAQLSEWLA